MIVDYTHSMFGTLSGKEPNTRKYYEGNDNAEKLAHVKQDPVLRKKLYHNGFTEDTIITYDIDQFGFRNSNKVLDASSVLALGCSYTFGVGHHNKDTWPALVEQAIGVPVYNAGVPGCSQDTVFRILNNILAEYTPKIVCVYAPQPGRWELIGSDNLYKNYYPKGGKLGNDPIEYRQCSSEERIRNNAFKNKVAISHICNMKNIPLVWFDADNDSPDNEVAAFIDDDLARDMLHPGVKYQAKVATAFINEIKRI